MQGLPIHPLPAAPSAVGEVRGGAFDKRFVVAGPIAGAGPVNLTDLADGTSEVAY
jgi:hypothetical protein